jgi:hypothetical protein
MVVRRWLIGRISHHCRRLQTANGMHPESRACSLARITSYVARGCCDMVTFGLHFLASIFQLVVPLGQTGRAAPVSDQTEAWDDLQLLRRSCDPTPRGSHRQWNPPLLKSRTVAPYGMRYCLEVSGPASVSGGLRACANRRLILRFPRRDAGAVAAVWRARICAPMGYVRSLCLPRSARPTTKLQERPCFTIRVHPL